MSSIGETNPDNNTDGIMKVITPKTACCCVLQMEEINNPTPTIDNNEIDIEAKNKITDPLNGISKNCVTMILIKHTKIMDIMSGGIVFPIKISNDESGLTMSWSNVPISRSRAIDRAVSRRVITTASIATTTVRVNQRYSKFGLYQFLVTTFIMAPLDEIS